MRSYFKKPLPRWQIAVEMLVLGFISPPIAPSATARPACRRATSPRGLYPPAPDLASAGARHTDAELFWIIKNGIKMSGMPAWGETHSDEELWALAAFVDDLPEMSASEYRALVPPGTTGNDAAHHEH